MKQFVMSARLVCCKAGVFLFCFFHSFHIQLAARLASSFHRHPVFSPICVSRHESLGAGVQTGARVHFRCTHHMELQTHVVNTTTNPGFLHPVQTIFFFVGITDLYGGELNSQGCTNQAIFSFLFQLYFLCSNNKISYSCSFPIINCTSPLRDYRPGKSV